MPTGYTAKLYEGDQAFEDFVWTCARAFGALVMMRDDANDAKIDESKLTDNYNERNLALDESKLAEWNQTTEEQRRAMYSSHVEREQAERKKSEETRTARRARYQAMLDKVRAWEAPSSEHQNFRSFMFEQLEKSIDFDCSVYDHGPIPGFEEWCVLEQERLTRALDYRRKEVVKERARNEERLQWVRQLRESVPLPERLKP